MKFSPYLVYYVLLKRQFQTQNTSVIVLLWRCFPEVNKRMFVSMLACCQRLSLRTAGRWSSRWLSWWPTENMKHEPDVGQEPSPRRRAGGQTETETGEITGVMYLYLQNHNEVHQYIKYDTMEPQVPQTTVIKYQTEV